MKFRRKEGNDPIVIILAREYSTPDRQFENDNEAFEWLTLVRPTEYKFYKLLAAEIRRAIASEVDCYD